MKKTPPIVHEVEEIKQVIVSETAEIGGIQDRFSIMENVWGHPFTIRQHFLSVMRDAVEGHITRDYEGRRLVDI